MRLTWLSPARIITGAHYSTLLESAAAVVLAMKDNRMLDMRSDLVLKVTRAIQMMLLSHKSDYEQYRMPEMELHLRMSSSRRGLQLQAEPDVKEADL